MKKVLLAIYILIVATLSVTVRAEEVQLQVTAASVDVESQVIKVEGYFSTPCVRLSGIKTELIADKTILLSFVGQNPSSVCIQMLGSTLALAVEAANIKHELLRKQIEIDGTYRIISKQAEIDTEFDFSNILPRPFSVKTMVGKIISVDGKLSLETQDKEISLVSPFIDVESLIGATVEAVGHLDGADLVDSDVFRTGIKRSKSTFVITGLRLSPKTDPSPSYQSLRQ